MGIANLSVVAVLSNLKCLVMSLVTRITVLASLRMVLANGQCHSVD